MAFTLQDWLTRNRGSDPSMIGNLVAPEGSLVPKILQPYDLRNRNRQSSLVNSLTQDPGDISRFSVGDDGRGGEGSNFGGEGTGFGGMSAADQGAAGGFEAANRGRTHAGTVANENAVNNVQTIGTAVADILGLGLPAAAINAAVNYGQAQGISSDMTGYDGFASLGIGNPSSFGQNRGETEANTGLSDAEMGYGGGNNAPGGTESTGPAGSPGGMNAGGVGPGNPDGNGGGGNSGSGGSSDSEGGMGGGQSGTGSDAW
jgi:hypothetical protein